MVSIFCWMYFGIGVFGVGVFRYVILGVLFGYFVELMERGWVGYVYVFLRFGVGMR